MTHLSDFSYLDRLVMNFFIIIWMLHRVWEIDGFHVFRLQNFKKFRLKTVATGLLLLSISLFIIYDIVATTIKYREGFYVSADHGIIQKPSEYFTTEDKNLLYFTDVLLNLILTFKSSAEFLIIALWNFLSRALTNKSFMSSWEFKSYAAYSIMSLIAYPTVQFSIVNVSTLYSLITPQIMYNFENLIIITLLQLANWRLWKTVKNLPTTSPSLVRIRYYIRMNHLMSFTIFCEFFGLSIINFDILNHERFIYYNKFWTDFLTKIFTFGFTFTYAIAFLILYPPFSKEMNAESLENTQSHPETDPHVNEKTKAEHES